ncbi:ATP-dependent helicase [Pseudodesulfovibrio sp. S3]|nr:ATP-dependent helicase [Pseudodesulfovibrio sp. S3]
MVAGAGSGKTTSLIKALQHIKNAFGGSLRKNGQKVACITYTEVATQEIWKDVGNDPLFHVSTIHSFLWELVRPFQSDIKKWVENKVGLDIDELTEKQANYGPKVQQKTKDKDSEKIEHYKALCGVIGSIDQFDYGTGSDYANGILGHSDIIKLVPEIMLGSTLFRNIVARKYPFFFVDESQDTFEVFVEALRAIFIQESKNFCLGFFGDPMQKIYATGVGDIRQENTWEKVTKPENFRSPDSVLSVINNIRADVGDLVQIPGKEQADGTAQLVILPADENRGAYLQQVREWLAQEGNDPLWTQDTEESDVKILVLVHRMAAKRLDFANLYAAFNDRTPESFSIGFTEDSHWSLRPFRDYLLPLVAAFTDGDNFSVMQLLRQKCPLLSKAKFEKAPNKPELLAAIKENVSSLAQLLLDDKATVSDVLKYADDNNLVDLDDRFALVPIGGEFSPEELEKDKAALANYYNCQAKELWGYHRYINEESPYDTHQGIKGAEFERVLVVLDEEEGSAHKLFSYEKLLGIKELTATDKNNLANGIDSSIDRTRRLFYVCCSRALKDLVVVLFTQDVESAVEKVKGARLFSAEAVFTAADIA